MLGPYHPDVAVSLNNYGELMRNQRKHAEAEALYKVSERKQTQGALDYIYIHQACVIIRASRALERAHMLTQPIAHQQQAAICRPDIGNTLLLTCSGARLRLTEWCAPGPLRDDQRSLSIKRRMLGAAHPKVLITLINLAELMMDQVSVEILSGSNSSPLYIRATTCALV